MTTTRRILQLVAGVAPRPNTKHNLVCDEEGITKTPMSIANPDHESK
jgi:hypothetical protein